MVEFAVSSWKMAPIKFSPLFIDGITYLIGLQDEEMVSNLINLSSFYLY